MKNEAQQIELDDMLPEYNFAGQKGVRGKYYQAYRRGHTVKIRETDGTVSTHYFTLEDGAVMLEPDVREYFPTSESVNSTLRALIALSPTNRTHSYRMAEIETSREANM